MNQSAVPASKIKLSETEEPGCSSNSVTHSSPPATSPSTPASTSNLLPSTPATPRSAMQKALIEVIQPQESNTTRRALELQRQKRTRVQKKYGEILTKEKALERLQLESQQRDSRKRKKIHNENHCKRKNPFISKELCDICKQVDRSTTAQESEGEEDAAVD